MGVVLARVGVVAACATVGGLLGGPSWRGLLAGFIAGLLVAGGEWLGRLANPRVGAGALIGLAVGSLSAALLSAALLPWAGPSSAVPLAVPVVAAVGLAYLGASIGARQGAVVPAVPAGAAYPGAARAAVRTPTPANATMKILDTSVIIDGRISDVIGAGFLEGTLVVPQFVLRELQQVADSSDPLKRNRGRKGLDILKAIQGSDRVKIEVTDRDFPDVKDVDAKLLCLAEERLAKILTNDYNLNKVAQLRGVPVLNVNDLANAMKPVVLPGETLALQVIKEGKERNQGVGYLDDGTMVVIDNGKRLLGQKVDVVVTSVIQTNAGKMIFGQPADESEPAARPRVVPRRPPEVGVVGQS